MDELNFELELSRKNWSNGKQTYQLQVVNPLTGEEVREFIHHPFDAGELAQLFQELQAALLTIKTEQFNLTFPYEQLVEEFGSKLFDSLIFGEVLECYKISRKQADNSKRQLRIKLKIQPQELATLPWEFLYDKHTRQVGHHFCLSRNNPLLRFVDTIDQLEPLTVTLPIQVLGLVTNPEEPGQELKGQLEKALAHLIRRRLVNLKWINGHTWEHLVKHIYHTRRPYHIFHFVGHGGYNSKIQEGFIELFDQELSNVMRQSADKLGGLLTQHSSLRLALFNTYKQIDPNQPDVFCSTANTLLQNGLPAVLTLPYKLAEDDNILFLKYFYERLVEKGKPVDQTLAHARVDTFTNNNSRVCWGIPVLHTSTQNGVLFNLTKTPEFSLPPKPPGGSEPNPPITEPKATPLAVFLCHASEDEKQVYELYQRLKTDGFEPWFNKENLYPGQNWHLEIEKQLKKSDAIIVCLSKNALDRQGYIQRELRKALDVAEEKPEDAIFLIPIKLEKCETPVQFNKWQFTNLFEKDGYERVKYALQIRATQLKRAINSTVHANDEEFNQPENTAMPYNAPEVSTYQRHLPLYILIDCSGSMAGDAIEQIRLGLKALIAQLNTDPQAVETVWLSIITFDSTARQVVPLTELAQVTAPTLQANGARVFGAALTLLEKAIEQEVDKRDWKPLVFVMLAGEPTDSWKRVAKRIKANSTRQNKVVALLAGNDIKPETISPLTDEVVFISTVQPGSFESYLSWESQPNEEKPSETQRPVSKSDFPFPPKILHIVP